MAWDHILSGGLSEDTACQVASIFSDTEFLQSRQFTVLHKIVLKLVPKDLKTELECSTQEIDARDSSGHTCAFWAAKRGDVEALQILLDYGANPNIPDIHGNTPLHHVRNIGCCNVLLQHGVDVSVTNSYGHTALHAICRGDGNFPVLQRLVEAGVNIDVQDHSGETAAMNAVWNKHKDCARHLIMMGADLELATQSKETVVCYSVMVNFHHVLELLLDQGARIDCPNAQGQTILHSAARLSDSRTIGILGRFRDSALDVDVDALDHEGKSARHYLEEREADEQDPDFRQTFEELLLATKPHAQTKMPEASIADRIAALDIAKETVVACYTPLSTDDEQDDLDDIIDGNRGGHGPVLYYDAVETFSRVEEIIV